MVVVMAHGQKITVTGTVRDSLSGETLPGVNISAGIEQGTATNALGKYSLELPQGSYKIHFTFIGYRPATISLSINGQGEVVRDVFLVQQSVELDVAVVTAGKYEQKLSDVTVSMSVMKPAFIEDINTINLEQSLNYLPGVDILDGQPSIRGGGGYSYGAGSRVSVLVDGLPMLTAAEGDVKWNFLPVEDIDQVEVLKGASSALYGSSALNGVMNIRTGWPSAEPETRVTLWGGLYEKPVRKEMAWWWDGNPFFSGASFHHARQVKHFDFVVGGNGYFDQGYRDENFVEQARLNFRMRHRPEKQHGLTYGAGGNFQWQHKSDFFIWLDADSGAFRQVEEAVNVNRGIRFNIDPWITYNGAGNSQHSIKSRYYLVTNRFADNPENNNASHLVYGEYQYRKVFPKGLNLTAGFAGTMGYAEANLYGDHQSTSLAVYTQADKKFVGRLSVSLGLRWEQNTMDHADRESGVVLRSGLNWQAAKATFLRASFGQGYRFPSIAERYTATSLGVLRIFPNPELRSETSWSTEAGLRQGFRIGGWNAFLDAAAFWTEYNNMIEFTFGIYKPDTVPYPTLDHVGFKPLNVGLARITGFEIDISGNGRMGPINLAIFMGYTYMNPTDLSNDSVGEQVLKYRYRHSFKGDVSVQYKKLSTGLSFIYRSFMERIDEAFEETILGLEIFPGLKQYRADNNHGSIAIDTRIAYQFIPQARMSFIVKNIFNEEYMGRPGDIYPPRNFTLQFLFKF